MGGMDECMMECIWHRCNLGVQGAGEFVPFLDTTSRGSERPQRAFLRRRQGPSVDLFTEGIKTEPICNAYAKDTMQECTQYDNIHKQI